MNYDVKTLRSTTRSEVDTFRIKKFSLKRIYIFLSQGNIIFKW